MLAAVAAMVAMVVAVVVVDDDNGIEWWRWGAFYGRGHDRR